MIRFTFCFLYLLLYIIITLPLELVLYIIGKFNLPLRDRISKSCVQFAFRCVLLIAGTKTIVRGIENIPDDTACLFVGNHNSYFDIISTYPLMKRPTGYLAKKEMEKVPSLNVWMWFIRCLFLDRKDIKQGMKTILTAVDYLKSGISIFVFPEGTRSKDGNMNPFKEGSMKMAEKSGVPIVPVAISNTANIWEAHLPMIKKATILVEFGKPIYIKDLEKDKQKKIGQYTQNIIQGMLDSSKQLRITDKSSN